MGNCGVSQEGVLELLLDLGFRWVKLEVDSLLIEQFYNQLINLS